MRHIFSSFPILALMISASLAFAQEAEETDLESQQQRLQWTIQRTFPIETIWARALLELNLSDEKIVHLRKVFRPYWHHRGQIVQSATHKERREIRERIDILKQRFRNELDKHLATGQIIRIMNLRVSNKA